MKKLSLFILMAALLLSVNSRAQDESVLLEIGDEKITAEEFMRVYKKNNKQGDVTEKKSIEEYLDLFINFRLKVKQAQDLGLDTLQEFREELKGYREQLARPHLINQKKKEALIKEAWDHMQYDVRASHILIKTSPHAAPEDTLKAWQEISAIRQRIIEGEPFHKVATETSEDRSVKDRTQRGQTIPGNKGDLGYFTVFDMMYPLEKTAYDLETGELSKPVRTRFGYHIIKLTDKIPAQGKIKVAHIMLNNNKTDSATAQKRLDSLRNAIMEGEISFDQAAKSFSDDQRTSKKGGVLPEFNSDQMVPSFIKAISQLQKKGQISDPVHTFYGTHLIRLISKTPPGSWEEEKASLEEKINNSKRIKKAKQICAKEARDKYGYKLFPEVKNEVLQKVNSTILTNQWDIDMNNIPDKTLLRIGEENVSAREFAAYLKDHQKQEGKGDPGYYAKAQFKEFLNEKTLAYKNSKLEEENPEFRFLLREYHDGILLFNLMKEKIWSKAMEDTTGLKAFYEDHKHEHMWGERLHATIYETNRKQAARLARKLANTNHAPDVIADSIEALEDFQIAVTTRKFSKGERKLIDRLDWEPGITEIIKENDTYIFIDRHKAIAPEPKKLKEVRGLIIAKYQNKLEEEWLKELRSTYEFKVHEKVLKKLID
ncbi:MAG: peptidylprolyl isomerase [Bacteroidales bacterium]